MPPTNGDTGSRSGKKGDLAPGIVKDIVTTGFAIKKAVDTVHQNEEE
jgi:orotate phosphoribosyltransferase